MTRAEHLPARNLLTISKKLDAAAWGLFFVWVGIALIANLPWGVALLGIAIMTLGAQVARRRLGLAVEPFWLFVGVLFALCGVWELLRVQFSLVPVVLIVAGIALLFSAMRTGDSGAG